MNTVSSRPYLPDLGRWRPLVVIGVLLVAMVLLALVAALVATLVAGMAHSQPTDQLLAPFRWQPKEPVG